MWLGVILVMFAILLIIVIEFWEGSINKIKIGICVLIFIVYTVIIGFFIFRPNDLTPSKQENIQDIQQIIVDRVTSEGEK